MCQQQPKAPCQPKRQMFVYLLCLVVQEHDEHFSLSNKYFQSGQIVFEFQQTASPVPANNPIFCNPQAGIVQAGVSNTNGTVSFTIEFVKYAK